METLLSTVAQISFTIVGLFFIALTVDTNTRVYWLAKKERARYVSLILLTMLAPGFVSIGFLIPVSIGLPSWLYISLILFLVYFSLYAVWLKDQKNPEIQQQIAGYETSFEVKGNLKFVISDLWILLVAGVYIYFFDNSLYKLLLFFVGLCLFVLILTSVMSAYIFLRKNTEIRHEEIELLNIPNPKAEVWDKNKPSEKTTGVIYLFVLLTGLLFYLLGVFSRKE